MEQCSIVSEAVSDWILTRGVSPVAGGNLLARPQECEQWENPDAGGLRGSSQYTCKIYLYVMYLDSHLMHLL